MLLNCLKSDYIDLLDLEHIKTEVGLDRYFHTGTVVLVNHTELLVRGAMADVIIAEPQASVDSVPSTKTGCKVRRRS